MKQVGYSLLMALGLLSLAAQTSNAKFPRIKTVAQRMNEASNERKMNLESSNVLQADPDYQTKQFDADIDHFTTQGSTTNTFKLRYLINDKYVTGPGPWPILFYCGNEGIITDFYDNSGFVTTTLATATNALVVFAEHRYYGQSMPFGKDSFKPGNVNFLTIDQAMMDYVKLLQFIKASDNRFTNSPVIAFGGSYGGMIAAWIRMRYPQIIYGAHASSAPILFFPGTVSPYAFNELATRSYQSATQDGRCAANIQYGFKILNQWAADNTTYAKIKDYFNACVAPASTDDIQFLLGEISDALGTMAQVNYPYDTNFTRFLPANPVQTACTKGAVDQKSDDDGYVKGLAQAFMVYHGDKCVSFKPDPSDGTSGWGYQVCNEMVMPIAQSGKTDMFLPQPWDPDQFASDCASMGLKPQFDFILDSFGGRNTNLDFAHVSNIIFSNGDLDPWRAGGVLPGTLAKNDKIVVRLIKNSAHHLELRLPNAADPQDVTDARTAFTTVITGWIADYWKLPNPPKTVQEAVY